MRLALALVAATLSSSAVAEARKHAAGAPVIRAGAAEGYWIWFDQGGWHLRVTTGGARHVFQGVVRTFGGPMGRLATTRPALASRVVSSGAAIRFELESASGTDGFDWDGAGDCMTFELRIDQREEDDHVHVGAAGEAPSGSPFDACR